jgi:hypothetical protein
MKKLGLLLIFLTLSSFAHKFYVSIWQINFAPGKQRLEITSRIFADDLNNALKAKFNQPFNLGEKAQTAQQETLFKQYAAANFSLKVNGKPVALEYMSSETKNNVFISYFRATGITKVDKLDITNKVLQDFVTEQQNIIQTQVGGQKESLLLTTDNPSGTIEYK